MNFPQEWFQSLPNLMLSQVSIPFSKVNYTLKERISLFLITVFVIIRMRGYDFMILLILGVIIGLFKVMAKQEQRVNNQFLTDNRTMTQRCIEIIASLRKMPSTIKKLELGLIFYLITQQWGAWKNQINCSSSSFWDFSFYLYVTMKLQDKPVLKTVQTILKNNKRMGICSIKPEAQRNMNQLQTILLNFTSYAQLDQLVQRCNTYTATELNKCFNNLVSPVLDITFLSQDMNYMNSLYFGLQNYYLNYHIEARNSLNSREFKIVEETTKRVILEVYIAIKIIANWNTMSEAERIGLYSQLRMRKAQLDIGEGGRVDNLVIFVIEEVRRVQRTLQIKLYKRGIKLQEKNFETPIRCRNIYNELKSQIQAETVGPSRSL